jgi:hypothetical protein
MRLSVADTQANMTDAFLDLVDQDPSIFFNPACNKLIDATAATSAERIANSCVHFRMTQRGPDTAPGPLQMPPIGTGEVDTVTGVAALEAWISAL